MSKINPVRGLVGYGDSDDSGDEEPPKNLPSAAKIPAISQPASENIHPAPIPHCPWSACYDEGSGFTYYWNQHTNVVTWEAPPEYLLALKVARQQLHVTGSGEVSAEEWQMYQQALADRQKAHVAKPPAAIMSKLIEKPMSPNTRLDSTISKQHSNGRGGVKRRKSAEDSKIELITSYYNSDSDSNDESHSPVKKPPPKPLPATTNLKEAKPVLERPVKKQKTKPSVEYGPSLPPNQEYTIPIGPELPPNLVVEDPKVEVDESSSSGEVIKKETTQIPSANIVVDDSDDTLLKKLKDKAKLLAKLGGELPKELQEIICEESKGRSRGVSPAKVTEDENSKESKSIDNNLDIDDLLEEIEKKELPKVKKIKMDIFDEVSQSSSMTVDSPIHSPKPQEPKALFPCSKNMNNEQTATLFPSAVNVNVKNEIKADTEDLTQDVTEKVAEKKGPNLYLISPNDVEFPTTRKKLRISNSVLPPKERIEVPSYTTKYSNHIEGFTSERTGLGFSPDAVEVDSPKALVSYGNGLTFTKGEVLNEGKKDENLEDMIELVEAKLRFLNEQQASVVTPIQEMLIQLQTLSAGAAAGGVAAWYWGRWTRAALQALAEREAHAAPPGWHAAFLRSEGKYQYRRLCDGLTQWEYPATTNTDMDISTTPPHPSQQDKEDPDPEPEPVLPLEEVASPPAPPPPVWSRAPTPPPPAWSDPPPPGTEETKQEPKKEITDELLSFYNDIAELNKPPPLPPLPVEARPSSGSNSPTPLLPVEDRRKEESKDVKTKKKSKVKISSSIGMKHKSVSNLVAKWQLVAEEIQSD